MVMKPKLDRWIIYGNCLVGNIYDCKYFQPGTRVKTDAIVEVDIVAKRVRCVDADYILLDPGEDWEHQVPNEINKYTPNVVNLFEPKIMIGAK